MNTATLFVPALALLFAATATAQKERAFHLPAGDHRLGELLAQCEMALKAPIARHRIDGLDERRPVHLQHALALPREQWEDVLATVLLAHDLVLTFDAAEKRHEVLPAPRERTQPTWIAERAVTMALAELAARPDRQGPVQVTVPGLGTHLAVTVLRPFCMSNPGTTATAEGPDLVLTGLAGGVRSALAVLASVDPALATQLPMATPRPWPRAASATQFSLPAGTHRLTDVVDALAKATHCNLLLAHDAPHELTFTTAMATTGDALAFEAALTSLLWTQNIAVLAAARSHDLMVVRQVSHQTRPSPDQAMPVTLDELLARPTLTAFVELRYTARHVGMDRLMPEIQEAARAMSKAMGPALAAFEMLTTEQGVLVRGFTFAMLPVAQKIAEIDRAP